MQADPITMVSRVYGTTFFLPEVPDVCSTKAAWSGCVHLMAPPDSHMATDLSLRVRDLRLIVRCRFVDGASIAKMPAVLSDLWIVISGTPIRSET